MNVQLPPPPRPVEMPRPFGRDGGPGYARACQLPGQLERGPNMRVCELPRELSRDQHIDQSGRGSVLVAMPPQLTREQSLAMMADEPTPPAPPPGPDMTAPDQGVQGRAALSVASVLPLIEIVARGISGAAGYAYIGEDPDGAGARFGMLGLRQDTGDMGALFARAQRRDAVAFASLLGAEAAALLAHLTGNTPKAAFGGSDLWLAPWKGRLMAAAAQPPFSTAQNEHAVEELLRPAAVVILTAPALADGVALAMALDVMAECGAEKGLSLLKEVMGTAPEDRAAFQAALAKAVPASGRRFPALVQNQRLINWRPEARGAA